MALLKILIKAPYWASNDPLNSLIYGSLDLIDPAYFLSGTLPLYDNFGSYGISGPDLTADEEFVFSVPDGEGPHATIGFEFSFGYANYEITVLESTDGGGSFVEIGAQVLPSFTYSIEYVDLMRGPPTSERRNRLVKNIKYTFIPGLPGSPGSPGQPGSAAYSYNYTRQVCVYSPGNYADAERRLLELLASQGAGGGGGSISYSAGGYACTTVVSTAYVPAIAAIAPIPGIPAVPSKTTEDFQLGWTGRAHSIAVMTGPGEFKFRVAPDTIGAVVGLTATPRDSGYGDIVFGFYVAHGITKIMESGVEVMNLGARANQLLGIRRSKGNIEYRVGGTLVYTRPNNPTPYVLAASLYSGGDTVTDPSFEAFGEGGGDTKMRAFRGFGGDDSPYSTGRGEMEAFTGSGSAYSRGQGVGASLPFKSRGGIAYAVGEGVMLPFTSQGESLGAVPTFALGAGSMLPFTGAGTGLTGGMGQGVGASLPFTGFAGDMPGGVARGSGRGAMLPFRSLVYNLTPADEVFAVSFADLMASTASSTELFVVVNSAMQITGLIAVSTEYLAEVLSSMAIDDQIDLDLEIEVLVQSLMRVLASSVDPSMHEASVYSLDTGGSTRYTNYGFNSFAQFDGVHYGAKADGIYKLQGRNDAGQKVKASIDLGKTNFGSPMLKSLPYCYLGVASSGALLLKVTADKQTYVYSLTSSSEELKNQRFEPGRGLRAAYFRLVLESDGDVFDLASIEFFPVELSRRL